MIPAEGSKFGYAGFSYRRIHRTPSAPFANMYGCMIQPHLNDATAIARTPTHRGRDARVKAKHRADWNCCAHGDKALDVAFCPSGVYICNGRWMPGGGFIARPTVRMAACYGDDLMHMAVSFPLSVYSGHVLGTIRAAQAKRSGGGWRGGTPSEMHSQLLRVISLSVCTDNLDSRVPFLVAGRCRRFCDKRVLESCCCPCDPACLQDRKARSTRSGGKDRAAGGGHGRVRRRSLSAGMSDETVKANACCRLGRHAASDTGRYMSLDSCTPDEIEVSLCPRNGNHVSGHIKR